MLTGPNKRRTAPTASPKSSGPQAAPNPSAVVMSKPLARAPSVPKSKAANRYTKENDLEGIVAKWGRGTYQHGQSTSWLKIREHAVFANGRATRAVRNATTHGRKVRAVVCLRLRSCSPKKQVTQPPTRAPAIPPWPPRPPHLRFDRPHDFAPMELAAVVDPELRPRWHHPRACLGGPVALPEYP